MTGAAPKTASGLEIVVGGSVLALATQTPGVVIDHHALGPGHWRTQLDRLVRAGFRHVDLTDGWLPIPTMSGADRQALGQVLTDSGVQPLGLNISRHSLVDPERADDHLEYSYRGVDAAAELGIPLLGIGFHPRLVPAQQDGGRMFWEVPVAAADRSEATWALATDRLRRLCAYAAERRVQVSIELYEDTLVCTAADIERVITSVGAPNLGINPDLGNTFRSVTPQREHWLQTFRGALEYMDFWHLKNYTRASLGSDGPFAVAPTSLGAGMIDYRLAVGEALAAGFRGPFVVEHYGGDALEMQRRGRDYLLALLDELLLDQPA